MKHKKQQREEGTERNAKEHRKTSAPGCVSFLEILRRQDAL